MNQETVLSVVCHAFGADETQLYQPTQNNVLRSIAAKCLCKWSGCTQHEVGEILKIGNCSSVGKRLKRVNELLQTDRQLNKVLSEIEHILNEKHKRQVTLKTLDPKDSHPFAPHPSVTSRVAF